MPTQLVNVSPSSTFSPFVTFVCFVGSTAVLRFKSCSIVFKTRLGAVWKNFDSNQLEARFGAIQSD